MDPAVRRPVLIILVLSAVIQVTYLWALPISYEGDASVYYRYAKWIAGLEHHPFVFWQRPPGYPYYIHLLGMTSRDSFNGVIAANALMGVSMPLLVYGALFPVGRRWAFAAGVALALSTVPFSYAKLMMSEQPYSFFVVLMGFATSRFFATRKARYVVLSLGAAFVALMMRNEASYIAMFATLLQLGFALRKRAWTALATICVSALLVVAMTLTWSWVRARDLGEPELFGSLHNYSGWQLFYRVYTSQLTTEAPLYAFSRPPADALERWNADKSGVLFVEAKNGPASAEIDRIEPGLLKNPSHPNFSIIVTELMKRGDNGAHTVEYHRGILPTDRLLRRVVTETVIAHPEIVGLIVLDTWAYLGVFVPAVMASAPPLYSAWTHDMHEAEPYDISQQASTSMRPRLFKAYTDSQWERPAWLVAAHQLGQTMHNVFRGTVGLILMLTVWFLPLTRHRWLAAYMFMSAGLMLFAADIGNGFYETYEHMILPYLLMVAVLSTESCVGTLWRLFAPSQKQGGAVYPR